MEANIKPSVLNTVESLITQLRTTGLNDDDIITLIQRRAKISRAHIKTTLRAISQLEREINANMKRINGED